MSDATGIDAAGIDAAGIDAWFRAAGPREGELRRVDELVLTAAPGIDRRLAPVGSGAMLGYGFRPYRPRSAKAATPWPLISLAPQKRYISLYVAAVVGGGYLADVRAEELGSVSCGKSCIRFTSLDAVDTAALEALLREAVAVTDAGENGFFAS